MPIARRFGDFTLNIGVEDVDAFIDVEYVSGNVGSNATLVLNVRYITGRPAATGFDIEWMSTGE